MNTEDYTKNRAECWKEYCKKHHHSEQDLIVKGAFYDAFDAACVLGKQESDTGHVINGWVARDRYNDLFLYTEEPHRINCGALFGNHTDSWSCDNLSFFPLDNGLFPDLTWSDEPTEVELTIKRKKK